MTKRTQWFPGTVNPVRVGWYEVKGCPYSFACEGQHYWDGECWMIAGVGGVLLKVLDPLPWRGILK